MSACRLFRGKCGGTHRKNVHRHSHHDIELLPLSRLCVYLTIVASLDADHYLEYMRDLDWCAHILV
jgi:hypothetical protein